MLPINPAQIPKLYAEALRLRQGGKLDEAVAILDRIRAVKPDIPEVHFQLGEIALARRTPGPAFDHYLAALRLKPGEPAIWQAALRSGRARAAGHKEAAAELSQIAKTARLGGQGAKELKQAIADLAQTAPPVLDAFRAALRAPDETQLTDVLNGLDPASLTETERSEILSELLRLGRLDAARRLMDLAKRGMRHTADYYCDQAQLLVAEGRDDEALKVLARASAKHPQQTRTMGEEAALLQKLGRFDEAEALFRKAIAKDPDEPTHAYLLALSRKLPEDDPLIGEMDRRFAAKDAPHQTKAALGFALAKVMEDHGKFDRVFAYLRPANDAVKAAYPYSAKGRQRDLDAIKTAYAEADFPQEPDETGFAPIFVTGLPRSGTTLVESIIAAHSGVTGGGELGLAREIAMRSILGDGRFLDPAELGQDRVAAIASEIERTMRRVVPGADRITDKAVQTYTLIGPLARILPAARFVVVHRDPRDTLLSIYKNYFEAGQHRFAYDLADLAGYYRGFLDIVAFWRAKMPGRFIEIRYEDLIAAPEEEARRLIAGVGLGWEDTCLNFHQSKRRVDTLSLAQVRQPIYKSSVRAWERYGDALRPLIDALGDTLPKE